MSLTQRICSYLPVCIFKPFPSFPHRLPLLLVQSRTSAASATETLIPIGWGICVHHKLNFTEHTESMPERLQRMGLEVAPNCVVVVYYGVLVSGGDY